MIVFKNKSCCRLVKFGERIIIAVNEVNSIQPVWVDEKKSFETMLNALAKEAVIGVDTESNSLHAYREQVCLIQFSTPGQDFLVDTLARLEIGALGILFSNNQLIKVFHASEYDILCLRRDYGFEFRNIFDTMQAARILGREKLGLGDLVEKEFGIQLDKHNQKANWGMRPLTASMQTYACLDTHYLIPLYERLEQELKVKGLSDLAKEDFERLCQSRATENHKPLYTQVSGYLDLDRRQRAILNELCLYREQMARKKNLPLFKVISNSALLEIAQRCPKNDQELRRVKSLPPLLYERHREGLLHAIYAGMKAAPIDLPFHPKPDGKYLARLERLKAWRKKKGEEMKVLSDVVLPRDILEELAGKNPQDAQSLYQIMASVPWRRNKFGAEIIENLKEKA